MVQQAHIVPQSFLGWKTIGGKADENEPVILPLVVGPLVPENDPEWLVLMDLKDIVHFVVASAYR